MNPRVQTWLVFGAALAACCVLDAAGVGVSPRRAWSAEAPVFHSPSSLAISPDGKALLAADQTARRLVTVDLESPGKRSDLALQGNPRQVVVSADGKTAYVAEHGAGTVAVVDTAAAKVTGRIAVGRWPTALALAPKSRRLYVGNQDLHNVMAFDLAQQPPKLLGAVAVVREPSGIAVTADEQRVVVANLLPNAPGTDPNLAADVSLIDAGKLTQTATVRLPVGSSVVRGLCVSPDGRWAYVVHGLGRFHLPITQLERGWVNTFALSAIDLEKATRPLTVLLDDLSQGAADPAAIVVSRDGNTLWIAHAGTHEVSVIDAGRVRELLAGKIPPELAALQDGALPNIWVRIQRDPSLISELENDLTALYIGGAIRRLASGGVGPRSLTLSPDEKRLYVGNYYSGSVAVLSASDGKPLGTLPLGDQPPTDAVRRGEIVFHDATRAFQRWHSCASCHPNEGRVDGLRWDFLGDGIGNGKDTISLVLMHQTEPQNRRATVPTAKECTKNGLAGTNMLVPRGSDVEDLYAYLTSLKPEPSPHRAPDGKLTEAAQRGQGLFEGKAGCAQCHPAPLFTDRKMHNVGVLSENEPDGKYDVPSLLEAYRTAPYLHDGRALTLKDVLTTHNRSGQHGEASELNPQEIDDLVAYLQSL